MIRRTSQPATNGLILSINEWTVFRWNVSPRVLRKHGVENGCQDLLIRVGPDGEPMLSLVDERQTLRQFS